MCQAITEQTKNATFTLIGGGYNILLVIIRFKDNFSWISTYVEVLWIYKR
ncbi:hypothetical protein V2P43_01285 [Mycoplasma capricolum subsp. capricolum]